MLYSEKDLLKAMYYACGMQKAEDYQVAGNNLTGKEPIGGIELTLNYLWDTDNNESKNITIQDINEYLKENP